MRIIELKANIHVCQPEGLTETERTLIESAIKATETSYAKYSNFKVGAAALLSGGTIVTGSNQENASYPLGLCAESTTIFAANSQYPDQAVVTLCIAAKNERDELLPDPITPCGACRQVILEEENRYGKPVKMILYGTKYIYVIDDIKDILPLAFIEETMK